MQRSQHRWSVPQSLRGVCWPPRGATSAPFTVRSHMKCSLLTLSTFLDEELDARKRGEVEAHLVACDRCSRGITHLREESDRVSLLAQVHVADHSAHSLMEQVGIIDAGTELPMKTNASVTVIPDDTPPWLAAGTGKALP